MKLKLAALLFAAALPVIAPAETWCYGNSAPTGACIEISKLPPSMLPGAPQEPAYRVAVSVGTTDPYASALDIYIELSLTDGKTLEIKRLVPLVATYPAYFQFHTQKIPATVKRFSVSRQHPEPKDELVPLPHTP